MPFLKNDGQATAMEWSGTFVTAASHRFIPFEDRLRTSRCLACLESIFQGVQFYPRTPANRRNHNTSVFSELLAANVWLIPGAAASPRHFHSSTYPDWQKVVRRGIARSSRKSCDARADSTSGRRRIASFRQIKFTRIYRLDHGFHILRGE